MEMFSVVFKAMDFWSEDPGFKLPFYQKCVRVCEISFKQTDELDKS